MDGADETCWIAGAAYEMMKYLDRLATFAYSVYLKLSVPCAKIRDSNKIIEIYSDIKQPKKPED